jgi:hypothetical protein
LSESMNSPKAGINLPTINPTTMQMAIQTVRYFSQRPKDSSFLICSLELPVYDSPIGKLHSQRLLSQAF